MVLKISRKRSNVIALVEILAALKAKNTKQKLKSRKIVFRMDRVNGIRLYRLYPIN